MQTRIIGLVGRLLVIGALIGGFVAIAPRPAGAYGNLAVYQITISFNCNNPNFCGPNLGGFWGWAEFDSDQTADAELVDCGHLQGGGQAAGAQHFSSDASGWFIGANGDFYISSEVVTFTGRHGGPPISVTNPDPPYPSDTGIPAQPGHYSTTDFFGFTPPPGVAFQVQVVKIPNR